MQRITICLWAIVYIALVSCERENFLEITEAPEAAPPTTVEYQQGFALRAQEEDVFIAEGTAKRITGAGGFTSYAISSGAIICEGGSAYSTSYTGENFFVLEFYEFEGEHYVTQAGITTEVDGQPTVLFSLVPPGSGCQEQTAAVTINAITETEISGTFTGDFFRMDGPVGNDLPCGGFVYVDEYTASFSLSYEDCE